MLVFPNKKLTALTLLLAILWAAVHAFAAIVTNVDDTISTMATCPDIFRLSKTDKLQLTLNSLRKQLAKNLYELNVAPNYRDETVLDVHISPFGISQVNEFKQTVTITTELHLRWIDERLNFQHANNACSFPHNYGEDDTKLSVLFTDPSRQLIWVPTLYLHRRQQVAPMQFLKIVGLTVFSNGSVHMTSFFHEERTCSIETRKFPFDVQK